MIVKRHPTATLVANTALDDPRLSFRARGLLATLLRQSLGFRLTCRAVARLARDGRSATQTGLGELEALGYLTRNGDGEWVVTDDPAAHPSRQENENA